MRHAVQLRVYKTGQRVPILFNCSTHKLQVCSFLLSRSTLCREMATATDEIVRPLAAAGDVGEAPVFLITTDRKDDQVIWGDEERMKRELMAWAKAVASMALNVGSVGSTTPPPSPMGHRRHHFASRLQRTS
uniref:Uncharacterized protein n=1 Tax=Avena sativa TaxID=4498 RepID=A0ACD5Z2E0_AVESA